MWDYVRELMRAHPNVAMAVAIVVGVVVGIVLSLLAEEKPEDWEPRPQHPRPRPPWWRRWY